MNQQRLDLNDKISRFAEGLSDFHRMMREEVEFAAELKQYREQSDQRESGARIQPTDQQIYRLVRFIGAQVRLRGTPNVFTKPRDKDADPDAAKQFKKVLEYELFENPWKMFNDVEHRWIESALLMRMGVYRWDWRPDMGPRGEIFARLVQPTNFLWDSETYLHPHDPYNPEVVEIFRMPISQAKRLKGWKMSGVNEDDGVNLVTLSKANVSEIPGAVSFSDRSRVSASAKGSGIFTGALHWERYTDFAYKPRELEEAERYLECIQCDYQTRPQGDLPQYETEGYRYPEVVEGACPRCEGAMVIVANEELDDDAARMAEGKRLTVWCLNGSRDEPIFQGSWPVPKARTFPYATLFRYKLPHRAMPESDVSLNWTMAVGINFTKRVIYEQVHRSRGLWLLPSRGLEDRSGTRYDLGDDQDDVAFYTKDMPPDGVKHIAAGPVNQALFNLHQMLVNDLRQNEGSSDISMPEERTKDIPVGTLKGLIETGNIPIDDFIQDVYAERSVSWGVLADYISYTWTRERAIRTYGRDGEAVFEMVSSDSLTDIDVAVSSGPSMSRLDKEELEKYQQLASLSPARRRTVGRIMGIDAELLNQMDEDDKMDAEYEMQKLIQQNEAGNIVAAKNRETQRDIVGMPPNGNGAPKNGNGTAPVPENRFARE